MTTNRNAVIQGPLRDLGGQAFNIMGEGFYAHPARPNNRDQIARAIDKADAAGGGIVLVPVGTFLTGALELPSNVTLAGLGRQSGLKMIPGSVLTRLVTNADASNTNIAVRGLTLDGNRANIAADQSGSRTDTLFFESVTGLWVEDCWLVDSALVAIQTNNCSDVRIAGNWIDHPIKFGIFIGTDDVKTSTNIQIVGNTVKRSGRHGIVVDGGYGTQGSVRHVLVEGNHVETSSASPDWETLTGITGGGLGIDVEEGVTSARVIGNTAKDNASWGICIAAGQNDWPVKYATVADNTVAGGTLEGYRFDYAQSLTVTGNTSATNGRDGYYFSRCSGVTLGENVAAYNQLNGWRIRDCKHVALVGNLARANNRAAGNSLGFYIETTGAGLTDGISLDGNHAWDDDGSPLQAYGVFVFSNGGDALNVRIRDNDLRGNVTAGAGWSAAGDVIATGNLGFVTEAQGTGSIANPATTTTITHGLDRTVQASEIQITPTNDWTGSKAFWISASGGTTFTVSVGTTPAATFTFQWQIAVRH